MPKLRSPTRSPIVLDPIHPNRGIEALYAGHIMALISAMHEATVREVERAARTTGAIALDASPAHELQQAIERMAKRWQKRIDSGAKSLADWFGKSTLERTDTALRATLSKAGFTVRFRMTESMQNAYDAVIGEQVGLIRSIGQRHLTNVETMVMQSVQAGRDLHTLSRDLAANFGVTTKRAALIARDQNNKATAVIQKTRRQELGITHAKWRHSGAGKVPRPEHVAASGKIYEIEKGMYLEGVWTWPGHEINCRCTDQAIIPGFED